MIIRKAKAEDFEQVRSLEELEFQIHRQARPDYFKDIDVSYTKEEFENLLSLTCPIAWVAECEEHIAGLCFGKIDMTPDSFLCRSRKVAFIEDLVTVPDYRGQGVATALLKEARRQAIEAHAETMELCVWNFNADAVKLYEKLGMHVQYCRMEDRLS